MRLHTFPNEFVVEPDSEALNSGIVAGIRINRETGAITRFNPLESPVDRTQAHSQFIYGILGIPKLLRGRYLCVITNSELVAKLQGHEIRRVTNTMLIPYSNAQLVQDLRSGPHRADEAEYLQLFSSVLDTLSFYFSYTYDVTHSTQRIQALRENPELWQQPLWRRADERFFFNRYLVSDLIDQHMDEYVLPVVSGYVCAQSSSIKSQNFSFVIFSRRGCRRAGRRYTTRGCDIQGNAANFAETEQILFAPDQTDATKSRVFSFVQTRGSIPVLWKQTVTMKYMPTIDIVGEGQSGLALRRHFDDLKQHYGRQIVVNLVNQTGKEGKLEQFFKQTIEQNGDSDVRYVPFDFHKECKNMKYENLSKLVSTVSDEFDRMGYFFAEISTPLTAAGTPSDPQVKVYSTQKAAFRTNCMDSLDRTNVVQSVLARRVLNTQFQQLNITATEDPSRGFASAQFEHIFKNVWANNADSMAVQYTGTGALKTDYTRTGKRTPAGGFADFTNSAKRYVLNNFYDGYVQDGLDLFLGNYVPDPSKPSPLQPKPGAKSPSIFKFLMQVGLVLMAAFLLWGLFGPWFGIPTPTGRLRVFLYLVLYPLVAFKACEKKGKKFVVHPRLKPEFDQDPGKLKSA